MYSKPRRSGQLGRVSQLERQSYPSHHGLQDMHSLGGASTTSVETRATSSNSSDLFNERNPETLVGPVEVSVDEIVDPQGQNALDQLVVLSHKLSQQPAAAKRFNFDKVEGFHDYFKTKLSQDGIWDLSASEPHVAVRESNLYLEKARAETERLAQKYSSEKYAPVFGDMGIIDTITQIMNIISFVMKLFQKFADFFMEKLSGRFFTELGYVITVIFASTVAGFNIFLQFDKSMIVIGPTALKIATGITVYASNSLQAFVTWVTAPVKGPSNNLFTNFFSNLIALFNQTVPPGWATFKSTWNNSVTVVNQTSAFMYVLRSNGRMFKVKARVPLVQLMIAAMAFFLYYFDIDFFDWMDRLSDVYNNNEMLKNLINTSIRVIGQLKSAMQHLKIFIWGLISSVVQPVVKLIGLDWPVIEFYTPETFRATLPPELQDAATVDAYVAQLKYVPDHMAIVLRYQPYDLVKPELDWDLERQNCMGYVQPGAAIDSQQMDQEIMRVYQNKVRMFNLQKLSYNEKEAGQLVDKCASTITWCIRLGIPTLTMYEKHGYLIPEHDRIVSAVNLKLGDLTQANFDLSPDFDIILYSPQLGVVTSFNRSYSNTEISWSRYEHPPDIQARNSMMVVLLKQESNLMEQVACLTRSYAEQDEYATDDASMMSSVLNTVGGVPYNPSMLVVPHESNSIDGFPVYCLKQSRVYHFYNPIRPNYEDTFVRALLAYSTEVEDCSTISPQMDQAIELRDGANSFQTLYREASQRPPAKTSRGGGPDDYKYRSVDTEAEDRLVFARGELQQMNPVVYCDGGNKQEDNGAPEGSDSE